MVLQAGIIVPPESLQELLLNDFLDQAVTSVVFCVAFDLFSEVCTNIADFHVGVTVVLIWKASFSFIRRKLLL
ncbi:hypothetical protein D918_02463 [Trichuris suis]|nr:hypothetical protein D918_02463 [Trichuris suis]